LLLEKIPFFALAIISSAITFFVQRGGGAVVALENYTLIPRLIKAVVSYSRYLGKTFYPESLAVFYPYEGGWASWQPIAAILLLVAISLAALCGLRRRPYFFVGWFWFVGMLVPVIGIVQVGSQSMADRYTYLPHIGLFVAVIWFAADWLRAGAPVSNRLSASHKTKPVAYPHSLARIVYAAAGIFLLSCVAVSSVQVRHWRNTKTLLQHAVAVTTGNAPAHYYLGYVFDELGASDEALDQYTRAIRISPDFVDAHCNIGNILSRQNKPEEAAESYARALQSNPNFAPAHYGLA
jgi:tetratricopeptide (TPR) repeat protein